MDTITVLDGGVADIECTIDEQGRVLVAPADLEAATGWDRRPEGLCRGDVCVPVPDRALVEPAGDGTGIDLAGVARVLDRPVVVDLDARVVALGAPRHQRAAALAGGEAPELALPDVDGTEVRLADLRGTKAVVVAFATWCGCREDLPGWEALRDEVGAERLAVVPVALDEDAEDVRPFAEQVDLPVLVDREHRLSDVLGVSNVPAAVWIDEDGRVARPPIVAFGTDVWEEFHGVPSGPHLEAIKRWVATGEVPAGSANEAAGGEGSTPGDLDDDEVAARLWFRIAAHLRREGRTDEALERFERARALAPHDFTVARAAMPLTGRDPFGQEFLDLYADWEAAGRPFHGLEPDR